MPKNKRNVLLHTEISYPVPGEHALYSNHDVLSEGSDDAEKGLLIRFDILVNPYFACGVEDADKHFFGMKVDSAIVFVLFGVKSHWASSFGLKCFLVQEAFYHASGGGLK
jgi:hypothetical protein